MQTIYLDISNKGVVPTVYAKQNDVGRKFAVILTDSGLPYIPEIGSVFSVWYKGASGEGNYTDIGDKSAFSLDGNKVEVEMIVQMLSAHGDGILCLTLNSTNGNQISSWNIPYLCEKVPGFESEGAKEYYTAFSESVKKLKQVTENLTPEAIGAAPSGYGLGTNAPHAPNSDANKYDYSKTGYFVALYNCPVAGVYFVGYNISYGAGYAYQVMYGLNAHRIMAQRMISEGTIGEWEFINPPMALSTEYRTTERWNGKPVYVQLIDFKESSDFKTGEVEGVNTLLEITGVCGNQTMPWYSNTANQQCYIFAYTDSSKNIAHLTLRCGTANTGMPTYIKLKYTK